MSDRKNRREELEIARHLAYLDFCDGTEGTPRKEATEIYKQLYMMEMEQEKLDNEEKAKSETRQEDKKEKNFNKVLNALSLGADVSFKGLTTYLGWREIKGLIWSKDQPVIVHQDILQASRRLMEKAAKGVSRLRFK